MKFHATRNGKIGEINTKEHPIDLVIGISQFLCPLYRTGPKQREVVRSEAERMRRNGVIGPKYSPWTSPFVLAPKKDREFRFRIEYCRLKEMKVRGNYPIPKMKECIDSHGYADTFTKF